MQILDQEKLLVINCKNYLEVATAPRLKKLIASAVRSSVKYGVVIGVAPPVHLLGVAASYLKDEKRFDTSKLLIFSQHTDQHDAGSTTGYIVAELLHKSRVVGSIINHSEHRIKPAEIAHTIKKLSKLNMVSILCVRNIREVKKYAPLNPDYVAIEPPELIGSGMAVSTQRPELISGAADALCNSESKLLCGAGIISGKDVAKAVELGSKGILVASGVIKKNTQWNGAISELAKPLVPYDS